MQQIECPKCKKSFESDNIKQGITEIKCSECRQQIQITKKVTDVKLSKQFKTYIDNEKNLIIEKKLFNWFEISGYFFTVLFASVCMWFLWKSSETDKNNSFLTFFKSLLFIKPVLTYGIVAMTIITFITCLHLINLLFNTRKIIVGNTYLNISVSPLPLSIAKKIPTHDIKQLYCEKILARDGESTSALFLTLLLKSGKTVRLCESYDFEEIRGLEILIEKRLGIEDKIVEGEMLALDLNKIDE